MYSLENWMQLLMYVWSLPDSVDYCFKSPEISVIISRNIVEWHLYVWLGPFDMRTKFDSVAWWSSDALLFYNLTFCSEIFYQSGLILPFTATSGNNNRKTSNTNTIQPNVKCHVKFEGMWGGNFGGRLLVCLKHIKTSLAAYGKGHNATEWL